MWIKVPCIADRPSLMLWKTGRNMSAIAQDEIWYLAGSCYKHDSNTISECVHRVSTGFSGSRLRLCDTETLIVKYLEWELPMLHLKSMWATDLSWWSIWQEINQAIRPYSWYKIERSKWEAHETISPAIVQGLSIELNACQKLVELYSSGGTNTRLNTVKAST